LVHTVSFTVKKLPGLNFPLFFRIYSSTVKKAYCPLMDFSASFREAKTPWK